MTAFECLCEASKSFPLLPAPTPAPKSKGPKRSKKFTITITSIERIKWQIADCERQLEELRREAAKKAHARELAAAKKAVGKIKKHV